MIIKKESNIDVGDVLVIDILKNGFFQQFICIVISNQNKLSLLNLETNSIIATFDNNLVLSKYFERYDFNKYDIKRSVINKKHL